MVKTTEGVKVLLGEPKRAVLKLGLPMVAALTAQIFYNLTDAVWVSGLGSDALSAIGLNFPIYMFSIALSSGLGVGGGAAVSRYIGAKNKENADSAAAHTIWGMVITFVLLMIPILFFIENIFSAMGASTSLELAVQYGKIIFSCSLFFFFGQVSTMLLRAEGDAKRAMFAMILGSGLNVVLDPIFIYGFGLGVAGAAWASVISMALISILLGYWLFVDKKTYLTIRLFNSLPRLDIIKDILKVGIPSSASQISMSLMMLIMNNIISSVSGTNGIAVFGAGWRLVMFAVLPSMGLATAIISISGAAVGSREFKKLDISYMYALKIGVFVECVIAVIVYFCAPMIAHIFTWSKGSEHLYNDLVSFLRIIVLFFPALPFGMFSSATFQGTGKGFYALLLTVFRTIILVLPFSWFFAVKMNLGIEGIWFGIIVGTWIAVLIGFLMVRVYIKNLLKT